MFRDEEIRPGLPSPSTSPCVHIVRVFGHVDALASRVLDRARDRGIVRNVKVVQQAARVIGMPCRPVWRRYAERPARSLGLSNAQLLRADTIVPVISNVPHLGQAHVRGSPAVGSTSSRPHTGHGKGRASSLCLRLIRLTLSQSR
jgi:hypothetical protein